MRIRLATDPVHVRLCMRGLTGHTDAQLLNRRKACALGADDSAQPPTAARVHADDDQAPLAGVVFSPALARANDHQRLRTCTQLG